MQVMTQFLDLPRELLPLIFQHISTSKSLASVCLVNATFYAWAVPILYEHIFVLPFHNNSQTTLLLTTLASHPHLAKHVQYLDIRTFPNGIFVQYFVSTTFIKALENCVNLRGCAFARYIPIYLTGGMKVLQRCPRLRALELCGGLHAPLSGFRSLSKLSLIMPTTVQVSSLPDWMMSTGVTLRSLTCEVSTTSSRAMTDNTLKLMSPNLANLEELRLVDCDRVTDEGIWDVLSQNAKGIRRLHLEGLEFNMTAFSRRCAQSGVTSNLRSISLTIDHRVSPTSWTADVCNLLSCSPLEEFQVHSRLIMKSEKMGAFWSILVPRHGARLTRLAIHRILLTPDIIEEICRQCPNLKDFYFMVDDYLPSLTRYLSTAKKLRILHISSPTGGLSGTDALALIKQCSFTLSVFGYGIEAWQIDRKARRHDNGIVSIEICLKPYEGDRIPEEFFVSGP